MTDKNDMLDEMFADDDMDETLDESTGLENPEKDSVNEEVVEEAKEETRNGVTPEEMEKAFGKVDKDHKKFFYMGKSLLKAVHYGLKRNSSDPDGEPEKDENHIACVFTVKDSFGTETEAIVNFYHDNENESRNKNTDLKIKYCLGGYKINKFEDLVKFAKHSDEQVSKVIDSLVETLGEDNLLVPIYRASFETKGSEGNSITRIYYTAVNRVKSFTGSSYSQYYKEHGGYPVLPDKEAMRETLEHDDELLHCRIMSINNNKDFKRFEIELKPEDVTDRYKEYMKEKGIYSLLAIYKYDKDKGAEINLNKRTNQAQRISNKLGVLDYSETQSKVGTVVPVEIRVFKVTFNDGTKGKVFRAYLA